MLVEVCANSFESAMNAEKGGADRIELCSELGVGGITPSYGLLKKVKENISIPVHVLIRPRSGDFTYSDTELDLMKENISLCKEMDFDGVVCGVLNTDFSLDVERTKKLKQWAHPMNFTFHRAFDWINDPHAAAVQLEKMGVDYILTSGQQKSALEGLQLLLELKQKVSKCVILPGGGIREHNVLKFKDHGFGMVHLSGTERTKKVEGSPKVPMNSPSLLKETEVISTSEENIKKICTLVK